MRQPYRSVNVEDKEITEYSYIDQHKMNESKSLWKRIIQIPLFCSFFSSLLLIYSILPLYDLPTTVSLVLLCSQIYLMYRQPYPRSIFCCLVAYHIIMISGHDFSGYAYIIWGVVTICTETIEMKSTPLNFLSQLVIIIVCQMMVIGLQLQNFIDIGWKIIAVYPTIIAIYLNYLFYRITLYQSFLKFKKRRNITYLLGSAILFVILTFLTFNYYVLVLYYVLPQSVYKIVIVVFFALSASLLAASIYFHEEFGVILCEIPQTAYRCSQTIFSDEQKQIKQQKKKSWDPQYCVLCKNRKACAWIRECGHLTYCEECFRKTWQKSQRQSRCPICKVKPQRHVSMLNMDELQIREYNMKFRIPSKFLHNEYLLKQGGTN